MIDDIKKNIKEVQEEHLKGYIFDSLVYRYMKARDAQCEMEKELYLLRNCHDLKDQNRFRNKEENNATRDKMRFIQILEEVIGVHD